ncbi:MAG TPA: UDP-N-acetylmuramoyl-tripeptide--D-alanyl-D-alanine ligase, partial [Ktedonobacterales bacterium]
MIYLDDFLRITNAALQSSGRTVVFPAFAHDSRQVGPDELFIAVHGERRDGHDFIEESIQQGAAGVVAEAERFAHYTALHPNVTERMEQQGVALLLVKDTREALRDYARGILRQWHPRVIAVTGSVGKTTTKEAIAAILESRFPTFKSWRNYNDLLGLPLSLGRLEQRHQMAVLELGCDHPGEIDALCELIQPSIGVVTRVSHTQLQYFGSIERYAQELAMLPRHLPADGFAILNHANPYTLRMAEETQATPLLFSLEAAEDARIHAVCLGASQLQNGLEASIAFRPPSSARQDTAFAPASTYRFRELTGVHWIESVLAAITTALALGIDAGIAADQLKTFMPLPGRSRLLDGIKGSLLLDDTHNAPPAAVEAALQTLDTLKQLYPRSFSIAVLGDMLRLGTYETEAHQRAGRNAARVADHLITHGPRAELIAQESRQSGMAASAIDITYSAEDAAQIVRQRLEGLTEAGTQAIVLIKGSEEMRMERVTERLLAHPEEAAQSLDRQTLAWKQIIRMRPDRPTWVEIDLSAIGANCRS